MFTGYFAKTKQYLKAGLVPVSIATINPKWWTGLSYSKLSPGKDILYKWKYSSFKDDTQKFTSLFKQKVLKRLDMDTVVYELEKLTKVSSSKIILLCYETSHDFCHRHLVAKWLGNCEEYTEVIPH